MRFLIAILPLIVFTSINALAQDKSRLIEQNLSDLFREDDASLEKKGYFEATNIYKNIPSLMFEDAENNEIYKSIQILKLEPESRKLGLENITEGGEKKNKEDNAKAHAHLGSILYYSPKYWVIWINNQKISSATNNKKEELYVRSITKNRVDLSWSLSLNKWKFITDYIEGDRMPEVNAENKVEVTFSMKPNQSFILGPNKIIEGKITLLKAEEDKEVGELELDEILE
jgi:uncharacterized protein YlbG (UPF0298 family)